MGIETLNELKRALKCVIVITILSLLSPYFGSICSFISYRQMHYSTLPKPASAYMVHIHNLDNDNNNYEDKIPFPLYFIAYQNLYSLSGEILW